MSTFLIVTGDNQPPEQDTNHMSIFLSRPNLMVLASTGKTPLYYIVTMKLVFLHMRLGGVRDVASAIISHEQTQSNRVCCFQTLDAVFPKDLFSDYLLYIGSVMICFNVVSGSLLFVFLPVFIF